MSEQDSGGSYSDPGAPPRTPTLPANPNIIQFEGFDTLNTKPSQQGIGDQEMFVCDGFMPLGRNNLRALRGLGSSIFSTTATQATGWVYFGANPANGATVTLNGVAFTFVNDGSGYPFNTGNYKINNTAASGVSGTIANLVQALNTSPTYLQNASLNVATYSDGVNPTTAGNVAVQDSVNVYYKNVGTDGNAFTLAASAATVSAATLTGGTGAATIKTFNFNTIGTTPICLVSTSDGNITQVNMNTLAQTAVPGGAKAIGWVKIGATNLSNGDTVTLNGRTFTFVNDASGWPNSSTNYKINIGGNAGGTEFFLWQALTTSATYLADVLLNVAGYEDNGDIGGGVFEVFVRYATAGTQGNAYTLAKNGAFLAVSAATLVSGAGFITAFNPDFSQWSNTYCIIVAPQTNGYFLWNGTNVFQAGGLSPNVTLTDSGANYTAAPSVVARGGTGTGATFSASVSNGSVVTVTVSNPGTGYLVGENVALTFKGGGSDSMASATATISAAAGVTSVIVTNGGSGYSSLVRVTPSGGGAPSVPAQMAVVGQNGVITGITVVNPGIGYTSAPTLTVTDLATGAVGSGAALTAVISSGQISAVALTSQGSGYLSPPAITIAGDGIGAVLQARISGTIVDQVAVINPGSGYTRAVLQFSGGNNAASAISMLMPFGVSGDAVATYQSRVWVGNERNVYVSAPGDPANFESGDGATAFQSTDEFLQQEWTQFTQSNGFLYLFGDSSINYISGVTTSGNPPSTTFSNLNVDPQVGTPWHGTVQSFGRNLVFANAIGVHVSYGGAVTKVSDALDGIYTSVPQSQWPPGFEPTAAVANIFGIKVYILTMPIIHPVTGAQIVACLMWDGKRWFTSQQENMSNPVIATQKLNSQLVAYCSTDGTSIKPMFNTLSNSFTRYLDSKLWDRPGLFQTKMQRRIYGLLNVNHYDTGTAAAGQVVFSANAANGDSLCLNGSLFAFKAVVVTSYDVLIGGTAANTVTNLINAIAALPNDTNINVATYASGGGATLTITYATSTTVGNGYTIGVSAQGRISVSLSTVTIQTNNGTTTLTGGSNGPAISIDSVTENGTSLVTTVTPNVSQGPYVFGPLPLAAPGKVQGVALLTTMSDIQINKIELIDQNFQSNA